MARTRRGPLTQGKRLRRRSDQTYGRANPTIGPSDRPSLRVANRPSELSRNIKRWEHEGVLETMQQRLDQAPEKMAVRRQTVEHPFGTIKARMGATHFLTKTLGRVSTEMSLHVLAYNLKRVMKVLGVMPLMQAMRA